jgi:hypothetical protein
MTAETGPPNVLSAKIENVAAAPEKEMEYGDQADMMLNLQRLTRLAPSNSAHPSLEL